MNCWEFKNCGREASGATVAVYGICPAAIERRTDGINGGRNGGRACWCIAGTFCSGKSQGTFADKISNCAACNFYKMVWEEQNDADDYVFPKDVLARIKH